MVSTICATNTELRKLTIMGTNTKPEHGYEFLENLVQSDMRDLEELNISGERISGFGGEITIIEVEWFK